jgi:phage tail protein X
LALAPPTPKLEAVPALLDEEPAVPNAVLALPLPDVEAPEPTVEEL